MSKSDLPGMLGVALGISKQEWPHTIDAQVWAKEFVARYPEMGEGDISRGSRMRLWRATTQRPIIFEKIKV